MRPAAMLLMAVVLLWVLPARLTAEVVLSLDCSAGRISMESNDAPLHTVFSQLTHEKGIRFNADQDTLNERITVSFKDLTPEEGLRRILGARNFTCTFDDHRRLVSVYVFSAPGRYPSGEVPDAAPAAVSFKAAGPEASPAIGSRRTATARSLPRPVPQQSRATVIEGYSPPQPVQGRPPHAPVPPGAQIHRIRPPVAPSGTGVRQ